MDKFRDPVDSQFDTGDWLLNRRGVLPVPIIITEPALGYGGGLALLYFHKNKADKEKAERGEALGLPPSVSAAFGFATENGSWAAGGGHRASWRGDSIRAVAGAGYASLNLTFYRDDEPTDFNIAGSILDLDFRHRIKRSDFFLGASYRFAGLDAARDDDISMPSPLPDDEDSNVGGIGLIAQYDSRDNITSPVTGQDVEISGTFNAEAFGGSTDWQELDGKILSYHELHPRWFLGLRVAGSSTWGDVPFYALPYVDLRGIPALRYQGDAAGEGELELRWRAWKRWSLLGFFGLGWTYSDDSSDSGPYPAGGGGFRYLIARQLPMQVGIDIARGPEDTTFYIQVGSAWN